MGGCVMRLSNFIYGLDIEAIKSLSDDTPRYIKMDTDLFSDELFYFELCAMYFEGFIRVRLEAVACDNYTELAYFVMNPKHITHDRLWDRIKENL